MSALLRWLVPALVLTGLTLALLAPRPAPLAQAQAPGQPPLGQPPLGQPPSVQPGTRPEIDLRQRVDLARQVTQEFTELLRSGLREALRKGGPLGAISACHTLAPELTNSRSVASGFEIERTALKLRNPDNAADPWELATLERFAQRAAAGADPASLEHYEIITTAEGDRVFRYMRGIAMGEPCLACHGPDVRQDVKSEIARYYPQDKALGFRLGELRGAMSLTQLIDE